MSGGRGRKSKAVSAAEASSSAAVASTISSALETDYDAALARQQELQQQLQAIALPKQPPKASPHNSIAQASDSKKKAGGRQSTRKKKTDTTEDTTQAQANSATDDVASATALLHHQVPMVIHKIDTHWDYILKEMQWLSTDFTAERKRHAGSRRKLANGVKQFFHTKEARALTALTQAEGKRRKLAARMGRHVQKWWNKMDQMVTYQQKLTYDQERHKAMNRKLVKLVQQTERYTQSLVATNPQEKKENRTRGNKRIPYDADGNQQGHDDEDNHDADDDSTVDEQVYQMRIEEALAMGQRRRKVHNYATFAQQQSQSHHPPETTFYGESTTEDSGSDGSFCISIDGEDDETTLQQAELEEPPAAMRAELAKLQEESQMDMDSVLKRLQEEPDTLDPEMAGEMISSQAEGASTRRVQFAKEVQVKDIPKGAATQRDPGEDADDDQDDSDVEDYVMDEASQSSAIRIALVSEDSKTQDDDEDEYFISNGPEAIDDETTLEEEEQLPQEMTAEQELDMLQRENEMSVEELRAMYTGTFASDDASPPKPNNDETNTPPEKDLKRSARRSTKQTVEENQEESSPEDDGDDEFQLGSSVEVDDETTIAAEEKMGRDMSYEDELALLQRENEMPIEQLRAMYAGMQETPEDGDIDYNEAASSGDEENAVPSAVDHAYTTSIDVNEGGEDDEFQPGAAVEVDDETTIEAEEKLGRDMSYADELAMLERENEMPIEELQAMYSGIYGAKTDDTNNEREMESGSAESSPATQTSRQRSSRRQESPVEEGDTSFEDVEGDDEYQPTNEFDDETTIAAEERLGRDMSYADEIAMLNRENDMSVEELRAMYAGTAEEDESIDANNTSRDDQEDGISKRKRDEVSKGGNEEGDVKKRAKTGEKPEADDTLAFTALEQSTELAKKTLATRPFLLANWVKLREYQQVGLNWLVSMQARRLNGILADEMGLGKTLQTIALIAYLASFKGIWGPHLIVVPTSVIVNWETEFKRFAPGLKVLCYYGSTKRRKELRTGWTKANWNHVVITSYQLAVQDAFAFKRKRWYYMVLDEAQNIKNFQSQRWQTLINFNTQRRLLLTGTPLQNSLMELWSLLHFLMPYIFRSRKEFSFWFENPMNDMIEGNTGENASVISRLHGIIRPFVLRRLKKDVEKQMPGKYEHIVKCSLSRRQMLMYEEFMARSSTRKALNKGGNFMGMMNVLMQLRKVCNHPDLFEPRSVITPFVLDPVELNLPAMAYSIIEKKSVFDEISLFLRTPLWCGSQGEPSQNNACRHDQIESGELKILTHSIETPAFNPGSESFVEGASKELIALENTLRRERHEAVSSNIQFLNAINSWRCNARSFPLSNRLLAQTSFHLRGKESSFNYMSTPSQFLELRKSQMERSQECDALVNRFVFCVPKAGLKSPASARQPKHKKELEKMLVEPLEEYFRPFERARARLSSFFPDKKLIQFDAGKLQTLAELLRELKRGGHRTLIFTQMSKMLDILEAFLNLNGHTYMRLDGSTGVDRRQRLMDRFNNDPKIFAFILSTRSGGTGVNLIGADTVVFYDSDWNPAMDAQAQDRVHRIGQTRDCHIYRLVTEHSIEENILIKAKQKKNLDILVMDKGKFDSSHLLQKRESSRMSSENETPEMRDVYSKGGLRAILGVQEEPDESAPEKNHPGEEKEKRDLTDEQMESTMAALEDVDDVQALKGAKQEAADELKEFDETVETKTGADSTKVNPSKGKSNDKTLNNEDETDEIQLEKEIESWQTRVGLDKNAIEASLSPLERYGFRWRSDIDPFYSKYAELEYHRKAEEAEEVDDEIDIDAIEREKAIEERQALEGGDLLGTYPDPKDLIRHRNLFRREHSRLKAAKKRRTLTGENWEIRMDQRHKTEFWYNVDTGEGVWEKPRILLQLEEYVAANEQMWSHMPLQPLINIMSYLLPHPERLSGAAQVCRQWRRAATDPSFVMHVYPVEMGAYTRDEKKMEFNHFRSLSDAIENARPGDTIELADGHFWVNEDLTVSIPLRIIGDENNPSHVVVEMSGSTIDWSAKGGWMEGITFRRPKLNASGDPMEKSLLRIAGGRLDTYYCIFDNEGSNAKAVVVSGPKLCGEWKGTRINGGLLQKNGGLLALTKN